MRRSQVRSLERLSVCPLLRAATLARPPHSPLGLSTPVGSCRRNEQSSVQCQQRGERLKRLNSGRVEEVDNVRREDDVILPIVPQLFQLFQHIRSRELFPTRE